MKPGRHADKKPPKAALSRRHASMLKLFACGAVVLGVVAIHYLSITEQRNSVTKTVRSWQSKYRFNDEQADRIREIEIEFHGNGSPFSIRPSHTPEETRRHHEEMAAQMEPDQGARFLQFIEKRH